MLIGGDRMQRVQKSFCEMGVCRRLMETKRARIAVLRMSMPVRSAWLLHWLKLYLIA